MDSLDRSVDIECCSPSTLNPHNQGRVRLLSPHAGPGRGILFLPEIGEEVYVAFEEGDPERPYVVASAWNGVHRPPAAGFHKPDEQNGSEFESNAIKRLVTKSGHRITFVDTPGKATISIATPRSAQLLLTDAHEETGGRPAVVLHSEGDLFLSAPNGRIHQRSLFSSREVGAESTPAPAQAAFILAAYTPPAAPAPSAPKLSKCAAGADSDKQLSDAARKRMDQLSAAGSEGGQSACQKRALDLRGTVDQFDRYKAALPGARAALDVNGLGDKPGTKSSHPQCVTRLPDDAAGLNKALNLPPGTITDSMLRDDKSGFRAAMYRNDADGKLMLVPRDTEPHSLTDWKTNTDNGQGLLTKQYDQMRRLTTNLVYGDVKFDEVGYSKGGGLAQEGGLVNPTGNVVIFNSAGIPTTSVGRAADASLGSLADRTSAFSSQGDFLTYLNTTTDPDQQIRNAKWLKDHLSQISSSFHPLESAIGLDYQNPETHGHPDPDFGANKSAYLSSLQDLVDSAKQNRARLATNPLFPPVRAGSQNTIPNTEPGYAESSLAGAPVAPISSNPTTYNEQMDGKLYQHRMSIVATGMETTVSKERDKLKAFLSECQ